MVNIVLKNLRKNWLLYLFVSFLIFFGVFFLTYGTAVIKNDFKEMFVDNKENYKFYSGDIIKKIETLENAEETFETHMRNFAVDGVSVEYGVYNSVSMQNVRGCVIDSKTAKNISITTEKHVWFSENYPDGVREIIIKKGEFNNAKIGSLINGGSYGTLKVIDYLKDGIGLDIAGYPMVGGGDYASKYILCARPQTSAWKYEDDVYVEKSIVVFSDINKEMAKKIFINDSGGYVSMRSPSNIEEIYIDKFNASKKTLVLVTLVCLILFLCLATYFVASTRKIKKSCAINFLCGATRREIVVSNLIIVALVFAVPCMIAIFAMVFFYKSFQIPWASCALVSVIAVLLCYLAVEVIKIVTIIKSNHIKILRGE